MPLVEIMTAKALLLARAIESAVLGKIANAVLGKLLPETRSVSRKIDRMLNEPLETGLRKVKQGLDLKGGDMRVSLLRGAATNELEKAYTYAEQINDLKVMFVIRYVQALCGIALSDTHYLADCIATSHALLERYWDQVTEELHDAKLSVATYNTARDSLLRGISSMRAEGMIPKLEAELDALEAAHGTVKQIKSRLLKGRA